MSEYIPLEIQAEILKRLPVKPLIQFRSVSKPWKCLIDSPDFIVSYGVRHPPQPHHRFILRYEDHVNNDKYLSFVDNDDSFFQQEFIPTVPDLVEKLKPYPDYHSVVGSSHGLLCCRGYYDDGTEMLVVLNPSIRKSVGIQVPDMYDSLNENLDSYGEYDVFGFGVCPITFDPTICKIKFIIDYRRKMKEMPGISAPWIVRVFTLSTGTWSILSTNLPRESIRLTGYQVVIDRFIYWLADDLIDAEYRSLSHCLIMSFDLTAKEFEEISLPDSFTNRLCSILNISKLRESLVLLEYHREFEEDVSVCSLWMMKEQGVNRSFTKLYNINVPHATIKRLLGFRKTGELILETQQQYEDNAELEIYDPNSEAVDNLGIDGDQYSFFMCSYMETMLLLDQLDDFIYSISN